MLYTIVYALRETIKDNDGKLSADAVLTARVIAHDAVNAQSKFLKESELAKSDVKLIEVKLGA